MPEQNASSVLVQSEGAALALLGGIVSGELGPFRQGPLSPAQWAAQRGEPLYRTLRRVRRWQALGVLDVQDTKKRAGRPVRLYGLTSPSFYIPHAVLPVDEVLARIGEPMERELRADIARAFADLPDIGGTQIVIHGETYGAFLAHAPGQPWGGKDDLVLIDRWASLRLTHADALAFQHELDELFARYEHRSGPQSYSLHLRLVASARGAASR